MSSRSSTTAWTEDGAAFLVLELLEGETIETPGAPGFGGKLPIEEALDVGDAALDALAGRACHGDHSSRRQTGERLSSRRRGQTKLLDFGLARMRDGARGGHADRRDHRYARVHAAGAGGRTAWTTSTRAPTSGDSARPSSPPSPGPSSTTTPGRSTSSSSRARRGGVVRFGSSRPAYRQRCRSCSIGRSSSNAAIAGKARDIQAALRSARGTRTDGVNAASMTMLVAVDGSLESPHHAAADDAPRPPPPGHFRGPMLTPSDEHATIVASVPSGPRSAPLSSPPRSSPPRSSPHAPQSSPHAPQSSPHAPQSSPHGLSSPHGAQLPPPHAAPHLRPAALGSPPRPAALGSPAPPAAQHGPADGAQLPVSARRHHRTVCRDDPEADGRSAVPSAVPCDALARTPTTGPREVFRGPQRSSRFSSSSSCHPRSAPTCCGAPSSHPDPRESRAARSA